MTTPPAPPAPVDKPAPPVVPPPASGAPAPTAAPPAPAAPPAAPPTADDLARLQTALDAERQQRRTAEAALATLKQSTMSDAEKALAAARAEGRAEAEREAAQQLAAAEFRLAAAGKLANAEAALAVLDLGKLLGKDGRPDAKVIAELVAGLAAVAGPPAPGAVIPAGARTPAAPVNGDTDWLRAVQRPGRRRTG